MDDVGDVATVLDLLDQIGGSVASMGDRAYGGQAVYDAVAERHPEPAVVILPRSTAVPRATTLTQRAQHLHTIARHGHIRWQRLSGYSRRSCVETTISRYKAFFGRLLHARTLPNQKTEATIACNVGNRMTSLGMSVSVRIKSEQNHHASMAVRRSMHQRPPGTSSSANLGGSCPSACGIGLKGSDQRAFV
jgi:hypothetical protein